MKCFENLTKKFFEIFKTIEIFRKFGSKSIFFFENLTKIKFFLNLQKNRNITENSDQNRIFSKVWLKSKFSKKQNCFKSWTKILFFFKSFTKSIFFGIFEKDRNFFENLDQNQNFWKFDSSKFFDIFENLDQNRNCGTFDSNRNFSKFSKKNRNFSKIWTKFQICKKLE